MNNLPIPSYVTRKKVRDAVLPVSYVEGLKALAATRKIDEAKNWATAADALAAWARMYKNDLAAAEARRLKAHAYRRMSELSDELAQKLTPSSKRKSPLSELKKVGLSGAMISRVRAVGKVPKDRFDELVKADHPASIATLAMEGISAGDNKLAASEAYRVFSGGKYVRANARKFLVEFCRKTSALKLARGIKKEEIPAVKKILQEIEDWIEEFKASLLEK